MENLQNKVEKMLESEKKQRSIAIKWINEIESILLKVSSDIWGNGDMFSDEIPTHTITVKKKLESENKIVDSNIYFRYKDNNNEDIGFYDNTHTHYNNNGIPILEFKGKDFWEMIEIIIKWIPILIDNMDECNKFRNKLLNKIKY